MAMHVWKIEMITEAGPAFLCRVEAYNEADAIYLGGQAAAGKIPRRDGTPLVQLTATKEEFATPDKIRGITADDVIGPLLEGYPAIIDEAADFTEEDLKTLDDLDPPTWESQ